MENLQKIPEVLKIKAKNILRLEIQDAYYVDEKKPQLVKCILPDKSVRYVDLNQKREVHASELKIIVENWSEADTAKLAGKDAETINTVKEVKPKRTATKKRQTKSKK